MILRVFVLAILSGFLSDALPVISSFVKEPTVSLLLLLQPGGRILERISVNDRYDFRHYSSFTKSRGYGLKNANPEEREEIERKWLMDYNTMVEMMKGLVFEEKEHEIIEHMIVEEEEEEEEPEDDWLSLPLGLSLSFGDAVARLGATMFASSEAEDEKNLAASWQVLDKEIHII
jgi:hypothetical protein